MKKILLLLTILGLSPLSHGLNFDSLVTLSDGNGQHLKLSFNNVGIKASRTDFENSTKFYLRKPLLENIPDTQLECFSLQLPDTKQYLLTQKDGYNPKVLMYMQNPSTAEEKRYSTFCYQDGILKGYQQGQLWNLYFLDDNYYTLRASSSQSAYSSHPAITLMSIDSYTIAPTHTPSDDKHATMLSITWAGEPIFKSFNLWEEVDHQPLKTGWHFDYTDAPYFTIKSSYNHHYLVKDQNSSSLSLVKNTELAAVGDRALWRVDIINAEGDYTITNKEPVIGESEIPTLYTLDIDSYSSNSIDFNGKVTKKRYKAPYTPYMLFGIHERYTHLTLKPEDIIQNNSIMRLHNQLAVNDLLILSAHEENGWSQRRFKISLEDQGYVDQYFFAHDVGVNPDAANWGDNQSLEELLNKLPDVKNQSVDKRKLILESVQQQLTDAYNDRVNSTNSDGISPSIIWLTETNGIPKKVHTIIDNNEKSLRVNFRVGSEISPITNFAFLLRKKYADGSEHFTLDDPSRHNPK
ncbi:hypothetical protein [Marinibactrum halimedae]|uniref:Uncharacterized protein n=1 Tax=Marinibactrum halimedae TaxID=1444977 RepID=A0AA37WNG6_9GAMM|nr:hypothetical protein [Marinibactrum halimedae]MCD9458108.1 hypothetical protein [Marinibactrum halimedae]GLS25042.1 hypothetical protein GCM10007877_07560 [Marinibactrum halimedae]